MYRLPNTSGCFMPIRLAPYPPIEWPIRPRLVKRVYIRNHVVSNEVFKVACGHRTRIHRTVINGLGVWQHDNHLFRALGECAFNCLWYMNLMRPLLGADGVTVQGINHGIAPMFVYVVAGRQEDDDIAIDGFAF